MNIFGFTIKPRTAPEEKFASVVTPSNSDGSLVVNSGIFGEAYGVAFDIDGQIKNEVELINRYRTLAAYPEVSEAIEDIVNEAVSVNPDEPVCTISVDAIPVPPAIKKKITEAFEEVLNLFDFNTKGHEIFERWYVDGKVYYQILLDVDKPKNGIQELREIDPRKIKKIKNIKKKRLHSGIEVIDEVEEYFLFNDQGITNTTSSGVRLSVDSVVMATSGIIDQTNGLILSNIHKAIKPANQLKMLEDAVVIYRIVRAPERRVFYIDVGGLPKGKAEQYVTDIMNKFKNKLVYDAHTGEVADAKKHTSMMEDFWLPRRDGGKGTEITTLPGGCLSMDTKVSLLDGRELSIAEIENEMRDGKTIWTYSCDQFSGEVKPGLITWAGVTQKEAKVIKITLDNGESVICTPDHKFPMYGIGFVRADEMKVGDSLIPLYRKREQISVHKKLDYEQLFNNSTKKWEYTHRLVAKFIDLEQHVFETEGKFDVIHHKNHDRFNNDPSNLVLMNWRDHSRYHKDHSFSVEDQKRGSAAASARLKLMRETDEEQYRNHRESIRLQFKIWFDSLTDDEYATYIESVSDGVRKYIDNLSDEDRQIRGENSRKNLNLATNALFEKRKDPEYRKWLGEQISAGFTEKTRKRCSEQVDEKLGKYWDSDEGKTRRTQLVNEQSYDYSYDASHDAIKHIIDMVKGKTTHEVTLRDVVSSLNANPKILGEFLAANYQKKIRNWEPSRGFNNSNVTGLIKHFGYDSWVDFRKNESLHNHRIVSIEEITEPMTVGTLTIDGNEKIHGHHTFALSAGIFTKNSNIGQLDDLDYFKDKLYHSLNVPIGRMKPETGFSIGRSNEVSRDEIKFAKFIDKQQSKFAQLLLGALRVQLISKGIINSSDWESFNQKIRIKFARDNYFSELKEVEILNNRAQAALQMDSMVGKYYSREWIQRKILRLTDAEIREIEKQNNEDKKSNPELFGIEPEQQVEPSPEGNNDDQNP